MSDFTPHEAPIHEAAQLPVPVPPRLVGRDSALAQVYTQLKENHPVLLHGPSGVGKTALAATLASAYAQQPGGVLWLKVDEPRLEELLVRIGRAYQISEIGTTENPLSMIGAIENVLRSNKPLIVLDGTINADVISRFISRCVHDLPLLIASERHIEGSWAALEIQKLERDDAAALFRQESRLASGDHQEDIGTLVDLLDHMPFGIVVSARSMAANKQLPEELVVAMRPVAQAAGDNKSLIGLTAAFGKLNGALQGLLLMLGAFFEGRASAQLLSTVGGAPADSVQQAINILAQLYLVERTHRYDFPYYTLHPLTFSFAQTGLRRSNKLEGLHQKVRDTVLEYVRLYNDPTVTHYNRLAAEMDNITATARWAAENGQSEVVNDLVMALTQAGDFVKERGYLYDLLQLRSLTGSASPFPAYPPEEIEAPDFLSEFGDEDEDIEVPDFLHEMEDGDEDFDDFDEDDDEFDELEAMLEDDEDVDMPDFLTEIGAEEMRETELSTRDLAQLRAMLAQARQDEESEQQLKILRAIGQSQLEQDMRNEAIATFNEILTIHEAQQDVRGELTTLMQLADLMVETQNSQAAILNATRGVKLAQDLGDDTAQTKLLTTLGDAHQQLGESSAAIDHYNQALQLAQAQGDSDQQTIILYRLGYAQLDDGNPARAIETWEQALASFKQQLKRAYEGRTLGGLGNAYGDLSRWAEAVNYHTSALHIAREVGDREEEALQLNSLAYAAYQANQLAEAALRYRQALHLAYETEDRDNIVSTIVDLSRLLLQSRMYLDIVEMLVDDALTYEPNDRDLAQLKERIATERSLAQAYGTQMKPVSGTARDYAANAYKLLEA